VYYGVRHSYFGQPFDKNGRLSSFDPRLFNPANAPQVTGAGNRVVGTGNFCNGMIVNSQNVQTAANGCTPAASPYGNKVVDTPKLNFAPRFGIAWDPFGKGRTSVRMGYGMYYDQILVGFAEQVIGTNPPYQETFTVSNSGSGTVATTPRLDQPVPDWCSGGCRSLDGGGQHSRPADELERPIHAALVSRSSAYARI
jgi:hypothetical protein